jgi:DHA1 family multidrug resistance protein-like MFS transporter
LSETAAEARGALRAADRVALATAVASVAMGVWAPFLPLFLLELGASSAADAAWWMALALTGQGITSLVSGPLWGIASDRFGRKLMFLRSLFAMMLTTLIIAFASAPWQVVAGMSVLGLLGGYIQAATALVSVSVPDARLKAGLARVQGGMYVGTTVGPGVGALLAMMLDFRGAIIVAAVVTGLVAVVTARAVPADRVAARAAGAAWPKLEPLNATPQLGLAIFIYFAIFALNMLLYVATPIALSAITPDALGASGVAFTLSGLASVLGVFWLGTRFFHAGRLRGALTASAVAVGLLHLLPAAGGGATVYVLAFALISLLQAAMMPATNALIATNVPRSRRGTAFGLATAARAFALSAGPLGAWAIAATSLQVGFVVLAGLFLALAALIWMTLREPSGKGDAAPAVLAAARRAD